jgi:hypothetical protein
VVWQVDHHREAVELLIRQLAAAGRRRTGTRMRYVEGQICVRVMPSPELGPLRSREDVHLGAKLDALADR